MGPGRGRIHADQRRHARPVTQRRSSGLYTTATRDAVGAMRRHSHTRSATPGVDGGELREYHVTADARVGSFDPFLDLGHQHIDQLRSRRRRLTVTNKPGRRERRSARWCDESNRRVRPRPELFVNANASRFPRSPRKTSTCPSWAVGMSGDNQSNRERHHRRGYAQQQGTSTRAEPLTANGQNYRPPAGSLMTAYGHDLMPADRR